MRTDNRWLVLVAMTCSLSMIMLDQTVVSVALPSMTRDLPLTPSGQQWVVSAYVLGIAAVVAFGARAAARLGPVTCFRIGVVGFFAASVACALAPHGGAGQSWLLAARATQGVGAALMIPVSGTLVMNAFPIAQRGRAMGLYAGISQIFLALGPLIGGLLTEHVSWRAVFWLNVPVGLAALVLVHRAAPDNRRDVTARVRPAQLALLVAGMAATVLAVQESSQWGWTSVRTVAVLAAGLALLTLFVFTQLRDTDPIVAVRMLAGRAFAGNVGIGFAIQFGLLAVVVFTSLYNQNLLHFSPVVAGASALAVVLPITLASQLGGRWYDRAGVRPPVLTGLVLCLLGMVAWTAATPHLQYRDQVPGMILMGLGIGLTISPNNTDALSCSGPAQRAQASGILQTFRQLGGTLGVAVLSTVVLGYEHRTPGAAVTPAQHAADAITVGFAAAAAVFALALVFGWFFLPRGRRLGAATGQEPAAALG
ncbi:MAG TPA: MFS transporter [Mycobacteriales bacterium]|nr:MFS transporter [Mycobacteriales bacterium]